MSTEKIDVLDLVISILQEHEKVLDELAEKLQLTVDLCPMNQVWEKWK